MTKERFVVLVKKDDRNYNLCFPNFNNKKQTVVDIKDVDELEKVCRGIIKTLLLDGEQETQVHLDNLEVPVNYFMMTVKVNKKEIMSEVKGRLVKKTLTIPSWINEEAEKIQDINFSRIFKNALLIELGYTTYKQLDENTASEFVEWLIKDTQRGKLIWDEGESENDSILILGEIADIRENCTIVAHTIPQQGRNIMSIAVVKQKHTKRSQIYVFTIDKVVEVRDTKIEELMKIIIPKVDPILSEIKELVENSNS